MTKKASETIGTVKPNLCEGCEWQRGEAMGEFYCCIREEWFSKYDSEGCYLFQKASKGVLSFFQKASKK